MHIKLPLTHITRGINFSNGSNSFFLLEEQLVKWVKDAKVDKNLFLWLIILFKDLDY